MTDVLKMMNDCSFILPSYEPTSMEQQTNSTRKVTLGDCVRQAMMDRHGSTVSSILLQENKEKYYNASVPHEPDGNLREVFHLMRLLNHQALKNPTLGQTRSNPQSFLDTLSATVDSVIKNHTNLPLQYVELGPEPVKTAFILRYLLERGVEVATYTGVDINPTSAPEMKAVLGRILQPEQIGYRTMPFDQFRADSIRRPGTQVLITMLGFQEGNEDPEIMSSWLRSMTGKSDLLLSEMQLMPEYESEKITAFYQNPLMRRFSKIAFHRVFGDLPSEYRTYTLPVTLRDGNDVHAVVMCEAFRKERSRKEMLLVTNYCLKYTAKQFQHYREYGDTFKIADEFYIGDESVVFQLSQRR